MPDQFTPGRDDSADESVATLLQALRGRGQDARGAVTIELDGTGRPTSVEVSATAMDGNRGTMERAIRDALEAAWEDLDATRREQASRVAAAVREQVEDLTVQARAFAEVADAKLDRALAAVQAAAARASGSSPA